MEHEERDGSIRQKILSEIDEIQEFISGIGEVRFQNDRLVQKAVVMSLINIGELSKAFSAAYIERVQNVPWRAIRGFRNIAAHQYGKVDMADVWKTITEDIPILERELMEHTL